MHGSIKVIYPNNISEWQMEFNSAFKGLIRSVLAEGITVCVTSSHYIPLQQTLVDNYSTVLPWLGLNPLQN
jgi:hypothetical protein